MQAVNARSPHRCTQQGCTQQGIVSLVERPLRLIASALFCLLFFTSNLFLSTGVFAKDTSSSDQNSPQSSTTHAITTRSIANNLLETPSIYSSTINTQSSTINSKINLQQSDNSGLSRHPLTNAASDLSDNAIAVCYRAYSQSSEHSYANQLTAMSLDYITLLLDKINRTIRPVPANSLGDAIAMLQNHQCRIILTMTPSEVFEYQLIQSNAYLSMPLVFVTSKNSNWLGALSGFFNHKVAIIDSFEKHNDIAVEFPDYQFVKVDSLKEGIDSVTRGDVEAFVGPLMQVGHFLQQNYTPEVKINAHLQKHWNLVFGLSDSDQGLQTLLNAQLDKLSADEKSQINNRWVHVNYQYEPNYTLLIAVILIGGIIFSFLLYRYLLLQKYTRALTKISQTDKLTNLYNRVKTDESLDYHIESFRRYEDVFSVILLDIDNFKQINDQLGHMVGDITLVKVAEQLKSNCRRTDIIGRWGGEEFLIICPKADIEQTQKITQKLLQSIREITLIPVKSKPSLKLSASFGIAQILPEDTHDSLIHRADQALLKAKTSGKDQYVIADAPPADQSDETPVFAQ